MNASRIQIYWIVLSLFLMPACSASVSTSEIFPLETAHRSIIDLPYFQDSEILDFLKKTKKDEALTILWFSDIHADSVRLARIVSFHQYFNNYFDDVLHSGDIVDRQFADGVSFWSNIPGTEKFLNAIGNHDTATIIDDNYHWKGITGLDCYKQYLAPYVEKWSGVVSPIDAAIIGKCYYYKDYEDQGVRLVVLDCMVMSDSDSNYDSSQIKWFESVLADARTKDLSVLLCSHCPPKSTPIECSFTSNMFDKDGLFGGTYGGDAVFVSSIDSFIEAGGKFISWICGDLHKDYMGYVKSSKNMQPVIVSACALCSPTSSLTMKRIENTSSEDAFNILAIDSKQKIVCLKRVGSSIDNDKKSHDYIKYDYATHSIVESR